MKNMNNIHTVDINFVEHAIAYKITPEKGRFVNTKLVKLISNREVFHGSKPASLHQRHDEQFE